MSKLRDNLDFKRCAVAETTTTRRPKNPPGLQALAYRIDQQPGFFQRQVERLAAQPIPDGPNAGQRPLAALATCDRDDPAIALLDAWATAADVLTFYQERFANEFFLGTALERRSVLELAGMVGHELGPGVAASAFLAFSVEDAPGSPTEARVPGGTVVQSIPGQDQLPQTFETEDEIVARVAWNVLTPRLRQPLEIVGASELLLTGLATELAAGDLLLVVAHAGAEEVVETFHSRVQRVTPDADRGFTRVALEEPLDFASAVLPGRVEVHALREQASFFGHNAPRFGSLPTDEFVKDDPFTSNWDEGRTIWTDSSEVLYPDVPQEGDVFLDRKVPRLVAGSWVVFVGVTLDDAKAEVTYRVLGVSDTTLADYALTSEVSGLRLAAQDGRPLPAELLQRLAAGAGFDLRKTTAFLRSELLEIADQPIEAPLPTPEVDGGPANITLEGHLEGLRLGQALALSGERVSEEGVPTNESISEIVFLQRVEFRSAAGRPLTELQFQLPLEHTYVRATVRLNANVVRATHGETVEEILGSGDGATASQRFALARSPLTHLPAPTSSGRRSALEVRVDGVLWHQVRSLHGEPAEARSYTVEIDNDGKTMLHFGDGTHGARLPSGEENVVALYRTGIGPQGEVAPGSLELLAQRPLGIAEVTNPLAATGAAPPDDVERARATAPLAASTLGRIVSARDFEDFARAFAGIGKVCAAQVGVLHLSVAEIDGDPLERGSALQRNLVQAIEARRLPGPPIQVDGYEVLKFRLSAKLLLAEGFLPERVFGAVKATLVETFAFQNRHFGQSVEASEVVAVVQGVEGVEAVDLDTLHLAEESPRIASRLVARLARRSGIGVRAAQLLRLDAAGIDLRIRTS